MSISTLDSNSEIVPAVGLGGLSLRTHVRDLQDLLSRFHTVQKLQSNLYLFEARYSFIGTGIQAGIDVRNGKIFKLMAEVGYRGKFLQKIYIGMPVRDAMAIEPRLYYDEADALIFCRNIPGVCLSLPVEDAFPQEIVDMTIAAISVEAPEAFTARGQQGLW